MLHVGRWLLVTAITAATVVACGSSKDDGLTSTPGTGPGPGATSGPTFHKDVEPILQNHCQKCHKEGGIAPFSLLTYAQAKDVAGAMKIETGERRMPPWNALDTDECKPRLPWDHDERLSDAQIKTIADWVAAGTPEGDVKDAPPVKEPPSTNLANVTAELTPKTPFNASGDRDQFRCFVLDHPFGAGAYISGAQVVPGNRKVVHHAVIFTDPKGVQAAKAGADGSFDCSGQAMAAEANNGTNGGDQPITLAVWVPGANPVDLPSNIAMPLPKDSRLIMQIHYSPGGTQAEPDLTKVQLRVASVRPDYLLFTSAIGNFPIQLPNGDGLAKEPNEAAPEFRIPANAKGHVERMQLTMPVQTNPLLQTIWIYGVMAHQHLAGVDMKIELERGDDKQCLLQDRWDFHWQRMYTYKAPVEQLPTLLAGDTLKMRCTYDNTMENRRLGPEYKARNLQPVDLRLGEQTTDEMCVVIPQLLIKNPL